MSKSEGRIIAFLLTFYWSIPTIAETITIDCIYKTYSDESGNHNTKEDFILSFIVDTLTNKSYLQGNGGSAEVKLLAMQGQVTFIEITSSSNIMTTTIDKHSKSVHSRNTVIFGELVPTQYYGHCQVEK